METISRLVGGVLRWLPLRGAVVIGPNGDPASTTNRLPTDAVVVRASVTVLNQASAAYTASGTTAPLPVANLSELMVDVSITAVAGTTPSATLYLERLGADGVWYTVWTSAAQTVAGKVSTSIGAGMELAKAFGNTTRLGWTITGTTPSFTFTASVVGK